MKHSKETSKRLRRYRKINIKRAIGNKNENWMFKKLLATGLKWQRQRLFGYRIFDFFCPLLGIAVEVDGGEHDPEKDKQRDDEYIKRYDIEILRVNNMDEEGAKKALLAIAISETWKDRRCAISAFRRPLIETQKAKNTGNEKKWRIVRHEGKDSANHR